MMSKNHYDVIIIGGRCAGASLALRLAGSDLKILLLDRATFPSLPNVPSAPFIHPGTMRLLDELVIDESEYTHKGSKIEHFVVEMVGHFHAVMPTSQMMLDRNYFCGIDRSRLDETLWNHAARVPGVTARDGFSVTQILKDDSGDVVNGIVGKASMGEDEAFSADLVVGADGRFSFSARQFGEKVVEEKNDYPSAVYHAEWENVDDYAPDYPNAITTYNTGKGFMILVIPIAERKYHIGTYMKSGDANFGAQGFEQAYHEGVQRVPHLWNRLKNAKCVTNVVGMRPIENGYREAFGANWALVGDAVHYKDPADGQGIYDALLESKLLAQSIIDWKQHGTTWAAAGAAYQQRMMNATHPTFKQTVANVRQTLYTPVPGFIIKTIVRWLINAPEFQREFLRYLSRAVDAADYKPGLSSKIVLNGIKTDLRKRFDKTDAP
ncbi:MAG: NAD(P)/FAD-dependent oxidoreductase [Anaerolineae bacterium]|nr:NAD(P)/FAD-dependent oxidoreductase [Anaerolineae bacterium]